MPQKNKKHMFFSVIIPIYNVAPYLRQCLDSVLLQSFTDYEILCINDGSTDESGTILEEYAGKHTHIKLISQTNQGLSAARNRGIRAAHGDYILFLDSDDWLESNALQTLYRQAGNEDMIGFNGRRYFEDGKQEIPDPGITEFNIEGWPYYNKYSLESRKFHFVCAVLRIYRRDFLLQHNLFFREGIFHEDNLFAPFVCYYAQSVKVIPEILYVYRIRKGSITQSENPKRILDKIDIANTLSDFFIPKQNIDKSYLYREIAGYYFGAFMYPHNKKNLLTTKVIKQHINWANFKTVSVYPRHKRIYTLLLIHPLLFSIYLTLEAIAKANR
ncbi:glycosyltransferase [Microbacter margulisiae]|uniref:Glycosyltransferase involved in cell wall biosynthesis n=1 Tax=Microbacter margulisiae TaxID=1350067 RepID=A0A7W5DST7_9PORP|nr:glycosyltransferase [Microbacter margulisiae]MBB3188414.1 glycosyltransferase involved in cell wall biosynthesis [Microbacter margulisiae]